MSSNNFYTPTDEGRTATRLAGEAAKRELIDLTVAALPAVETLAEQMRAIEQRDVALARAANAIAVGNDPALYGLKDANALEVEVADMKRRYKELQAKVKTPLTVVRQYLAEMGIQIPNDPAPKLLLELRDHIRTKGFPIPRRPASNSFMVSA
jgi:hypothetical protein